MVQRAATTGWTIKADGHTGRGPRKPDRDRLDWHFRNVFQGSHVDLATFEKLLAFRKEREWEQFHSPKNVKHGVER